MAEKLLATGEVVTERKTFRITLTLPTELKSFIETRATQKKYCCLRDSNWSAYFRDLLELDYAAFTKRNGNGKVSRARR